MAEKKHADDPQDDKAAETEGGGVVVSDALGRSNPTAEVSSVNQAGPAPATGQDTDDVDPVASGFEMPETHDAAEEAAVKRAIATQIY